MRLALFLAASLALADRTPPEWVHLVPYGRWEGKGPHGGPLVVDRALGEQLVANFQASGQPLPIDWEHQSLLTRDNGQPAPAAGWISAVELRADGIWGRVQWTARAIEQLSAGEYRYFSPVILFTARDRRTGRPVGMALGPGALTNSPFFGPDLTPVVSFSSPLGVPMSWLPYLITLLALPETATDEEVKGELEARLGAPDVAMSRLGEMTKAAAGWTDIPADAASQLKTRLAASTIDPGEHLRVVSELEALKLQGRRPDLIARGREVGKITPANEPAFRALIASKGDEVAAAVLDTLPIIVSGQSQAGRAPKGSKLTSEEISACKQMGVSEADYLAAKA